MKIGRDYSFLNQFMIRDLAGKSKELLAYMLYQQSRVNQINPNIFVKCFGASEFEGGFYWMNCDFGTDLIYRREDTEENNRFWKEALTNDEFNYVKSEVKNL